MTARLKVRLVAAGLLCAALVIPARTAATNLPNIYPPFSLFEFRADEAGLRAHSCPNGCASAQVAAGQTHVSYKGKRYTAYYYGVTPFGSAKYKGSAEYGVDIFDSSSDAAGYTALAKEESGGDEGGPVLNPLKVAHQVAPDEFILGRNTAQGCVAIGGLSYRNLSMYVTAATTRRYLDRSNLCTAEAAFVSVLLALLYVRADGYAAHLHVVAKGRTAH